MDAVEALSQPADEEQPDAAPAVAAWLKNPSKKKQKQTLAERWAAEPEWTGNDDQ